MSFANLKSSRKAKELQSFVNTHTGVVISSASTSHLDSQLVTSSPVLQDPATSSNISSHVQVGTAEPCLSATEESLVTGVPSENASTGPSPQATMNASVPPSTGPKEGSPDVNVRNRKSNPVHLQGCHLALPPNVEIRESSRHGRGIYAKTSLSSGTRPVKFAISTSMVEFVSSGSAIISVKPHVAVLSNSTLDQYCSACSAPAPQAGLKRCPRCKVVWYCNSVCITLLGA